MRKWKSNSSNCSFMRWGKISQWVKPQAIKKCLKINSPFPIKKLRLESGVFVGCGRLKTKFGLRGVH